MQRTTSDTDQRKRLAALTKLFVTFDSEPSQQRIAAYAEATARTPVQWLVRGVDAVIVGWKGRGIPRPAEIIDAANAARRSVESWSPDTGLVPRAGERGGNYDDHVGAVLDRGDPSLVVRAREIRAAGELVPPGMIGRLLSYFAAAQDLGIHYPVDRRAQEVFESALTTWGASGHDVDWWFDAAQHRIDLDSQNPVCSCGMDLAR
jgi:hypothetical protein